MSKADASRWIASDKSSRIPLSTFRTALELHGVEVDADEVECMVANMISRVGGFPTIMIWRRIMADRIGVHEGLYIAREADGGLGKD